MGIFYTLINAMQCGDVSLATAQRHIGNLSEAGVRLSAGFTALGSMIRPPKAKKGAKKGWKRWGKKRKAAAAGEAAGGAAAAAASGGAATAQPQQQQQHRGGCMRPQSSLAAPLVGDVEAAAGAAADAADAADDPFAEMEAEGSGGEAAGRVGGLAGWLLSRLYQIRSAWLDWPAGPHMHAVRVLPLGRRWRPLSAARGGPV